NGAVMPEWYGPERIGPELEPDDAAAIEREPAEPEPPSAGPAAGVPSPLELLGLPLLLRMTILALMQSPAAAPGQPDEAPEPEASSDETLPDDAVDRGAA